MDETELKLVKFLGSSLKDLKSFGAEVCKKAGHELLALQDGLSPTDSKSLSSVGPGARYIRIKAGGEYRVIYVAKFDDAIYVFHSFHKKTKTISQKDLDIAKARYKDLISVRRKKRVS